MKIYHDISSFVNLQNLLFFPEVQVTKSSKKKTTNSPIRKGTPSSRPAPRRFVLWDVQLAFTCLTTGNVWYSQPQFIPWQDMKMSGHPLPPVRKMNHNFTWKPTFTIYIHLPFINSCIYSVFFFENVCTLTYIYHYSCHKIKQMYLKMNDMSTLKRDGFFFLKGNESSSKLINFQRFFVSFQRGNSLIFNYSWWFHLMIG